MNDRCTIFANAKKALINEKMDDIREMQKKPDYWKDG